MQTDKILCPDCKSEMVLITTCCGDKDKYGCRTTHFLLEEPYYKCNKCRIEISQEDMEEECT